MTDHGGVARTAVSWVEEHTGHELTPWQERVVEYYLEPADMDPFRRYFQRDGQERDIAKGFLAVPHPHIPGRYLQVGQFEARRGSKPQEIVYRFRASWRGYRQVYGKAHPDAKRAKTEYHRRRR
jgi:hypothetical protein